MGFIDTSVLSHQDLLLTKGIPKETTKVTKLVNCQPRSELARFLTQLPFPLPILLPSPKSFLVCSLFLMD